MRWDIGKYLSVALAYTGPILPRRSIWLSAASHPSAERFDSFLFLAFTMILNFAITKNIDDGSKFSKRLFARVLFANSFLLDRIVGIFLFIIFRDNFMESLLKIIKNISNNSKFCRNELERSIATSFQCY